MLLRLTHFLCIILGFQLLPAQPSFVSVKGHQLILGNQPYYYIGANYWYGSFLGLMKNNQRGIDRLRKDCAMPTTGRCLQYGSKAEFPAGQ